MKEGLIRDFDGRVLDDVGGRLVVELDEEHERIQRVVRAVDVLRSDLDRRTVGGDGERVALVLGGLIVRGMRNAYDKLHFLVLNLDVDVADGDFGGFRKATREDRLLEATVNRIHMATTG